MFTYKYPRPALTVDNVILARENDEWLVLLIQRKHNPFKNFWALPGGFVEPNEPIESAALRELKEETGITGIKINFLNFFDEPDRDPRERTISMAFMGTVNKDIFLKASSDARKAEWFRIDKLPDLAFDHKKIIDMAKLRLTGIIPKI
jgi:8-oxo-dGTP diphosphatase